MGNTAREYLSTTPTVDGYLEKNASQRNHPSMTHLSDTPYFCLKYSGSVYVLPSCENLNEHTLIIGDELDTHVIWFMGPDVNWAMLTACWRPLRYVVRHVTSEGTHYFNRISMREKTNEKLTLELLRHHARAREALSEQRLQLLHQRLVVKVEGRLLHCNGTTR